MPFPTRIRAGGERRGALTKYISHETTPRPCVGRAVRAALGPRAVRTALGPRAFGPHSVHAVGAAGRNVGRAARPRRGRHRPRALALGGALQVSPRTAAAYTDGGARSTRRPLRVCSPPRRICPCARLPFRAGEVVAVVGAVTAAVVVAVARVVVMGGRRGPPHRKRITANVERPRGVGCADPQHRYQSTCAWIADH